MDDRDAADSALLDLRTVMDLLRAECPWKAAQTHRSLARYLLEETHEVLEALDTGDVAHLREELGDLLLQVYFHAAIAAERGEFTIEDVAADLIAKLVRRNPHVFPTDGQRALEDAPLDAAGVNEAWERVKAQEKPRKHLEDGLPPTLPALLYADKAIDRAARVGVDLAGLDLAAGTARTDPADEDGDARDLGDRLLALVAEAHREGLDPEQALRDSVRQRLHHLKTN